MVKIMTSFKCIQLLLLILMTQLVIPYEYESYQDQSNFTIPCFNLTDVDCIKSLLSNKIEENTEIIFSSQKRLLITEDILFNDNAGLHLMGSSGVAMINCAANTSISFASITNLHLEQLYISGCGKEHQNGGVTITNCTHVTITRVTIERSWKTGLALLNTGGVVIIQNCSFLKNGFKSTSKDLYVKGGGMRLIIGNRLTGSVYNITNCTFQNNTATEGGGLCLVIHEGARHGSVNIERAIIEHNKCKNGGGGINIKYLTMSKEKNSITNNSIVIEECIFLKNSAFFGGGTAFLSSHSPLVSYLYNNITFSECTWEANSASYGMAVDISVVPWEELLLGGEYLPSPSFINCVFTKNIPNSSNAITLAITSFRVQFSGTTTFEGNSGSCIKATTTIIDFQMQSRILFHDNHGVRGAAIGLYSSSVIKFRDDSIFHFSKNRASERGGAIYVEYTEKRSVLLKCFFHYVGKETIPRNVTFKFEENYADCAINDDQGDSIFVTYITSCVQNCILPFINYSFPLSDDNKCLGDFVFNDDKSIQKQISTSASYFLLDSHNTGYHKIVDSSDHGVVNKNDAIYFIPGKLEILPLKLINDLEYEMPFMVSATIDAKNSSVCLHPAYSLLTNNSLILYGKPKDVAFIRLLALDIQRFHLTLKIVMDECPPGYVYSSKSNKCECSVRDEHYKEIRSCDPTKFQATIQYSYWIGHENKTNGSNLASAICPKGFCILQYDKRPDGPIALPLNAKEDISQYVCDKGRKGVVCGSCRENLSVYYNSVYFNCDRNDLCHLGWLFYILSELVPVTILFLVVIVFNISFTSGPLNGVIFFMQIVSTVRIQAEGLIWLHPSVYKLKQFHELIYSIFDLDFFHIIGKDFSFCLWEGATALDMLAFRYVTILYSLVLVVVTVFLLRQCNNFYYCFCKKSLHICKGSIIHGLSAFLVTSYSVCTKVSLLILTPSTLHIGPNYGINPRHKYVVYYNGDYLYMGSEHLKYSIIAIFFIVTVTIIPPLLLLSYPLCYKLFALLKIDESKFVQIGCKIFPLEKIKPLFDSMQGAFKDRYRFFAGLYFLYRFACIFSFALSDTLTKHYLLTGGFLALMLAIHGAFRPYKKGWQNLFEAFYILNLFVINAIAFNNYLILSFQKHAYLVVITAIQNILILLPLLYLVCYILYSLLAKLHSLCSHYSHPQRTNNEDSDAMLDILDRRDPEDYCKMETAEYKLM